MYFAAKRLTEIYGYQQEMKIEKLSAIAELISSVAVVVTLVYLAVHTQQNTTAIQASIRQAMLTDDRELFLSQIEFPIVVTGRSGGDDHHR